MLYENLFDELCTINFSTKYIFTVLQLLHSKPSIWLQKFVQFCHFILSEKCGFTDQPNCFTNCQFTCFLDGWNIFQYYNTFATITEGYFLIIIGKKSKCKTSNQILTFNLLYIGCLGLLANFSAIPVLLSKKLANVFNRTLAFLALSDSIYILTEIIRNYVQYFTKIDWYCHIFSLVVYFRNVSLVASIYLTMVLALERFLAGTYLSYWKNTLIKISTYVDPK